MPQLSAHEVFDNFRRYVLGEGDPDLWAENVVIELPFAAGGPARFEGRDNFLAVAKTGRERLPIRLDDMRNVRIHETREPNRIIVEYELVGTLRTTGDRASALFITVMEIQDGLVTLWREYQNTLDMARKLGTQPDLR